VAGRVRPSDRLLDRMSKHARPFDRRLDHKVGCIEKVRLDCSIIWLDASESMTQLLDHMVGRVGLSDRPLDHKGKRVELFDRPLDHMAERVGPV